MKAWQTLPDKSHGVTPNVLRVKDLQITAVFSRFHAITPTIMHGLTSNLDQHVGLVKIFRLVPICSKFTKPSPSAASEKPVPFDGVLKTQF